MKILQNSFKIVSKISLVLSFILIMTISCKKEATPTSDQEYRSIAWNYLNTAQKSTVNTKWEEAPVEKKTSDNQEVAVVTFGTSQDALLGPIQVFVAVKSKSVLGIGGRF